MALAIPFLSTDAALLPSLLLLETVLSADNALALAALVRPVRTEAERQRLLTLGLATAIVLRLLAVAAAGAVLRHPLVRVVGGGYLLWLALGHFREELRSPTPWETGSEPEGEARDAAIADPPLSMGAMVLLLAGTNLAFSLDSICAALALTDNIPLVMMAATAGVVALRGVAGLVLRGLERFPNLANAAYLTVLAVGLRLVVEQVAPFLLPSEPWMVGVMAVLIGWGLWSPQAAKP